MTLFSKTIIALEASFVYWKRHLLTVLLYVLAIIFLLLTLYLYEEPRRYRKEIEKQLDASARSAGEFNISFSDDLLSPNELMAEINKIMENNHIITAKLGWDHIEEKGDSPLLRVQMEHAVLGAAFTKTWNRDGFLSTIITDQNFLRFNSISLAEGEWRTTYSEEVVPVYLGYGFINSYRIGDYISDTMRYQNRRYQVAGFFKKGEMTLSPDLPSALIGEKTAKVCLDYLVVIDEISDDIVGMPVFKSERNDQADVEKMTKQMFELTEKSGLLLRIHTFEYKLSIHERDSLKTRETYQQILFSVGIALFSIMICVQLMAIILNKQEYGIWYSNGASMNELSQILLLQNICIAVASILIALPLFWFLLTRLIQDEIFLAIVIRFIYKYIVWKMIVIILLFSIASSCIPLLYFRKQSPISMVGGMRE